MKKKYNQLIIASTISCTAVIIILTYLFLYESPKSTNQLANEALNNLFNCIEARKKEQFCEKETSIVYNLLIQLDMEEKQKK